MPNGGLMKLELKRKMDSGHARVECGSKCSGRESGGHSWYSLKLDDGRTGLICSKCAEWAEDWKGVN